MLRYTVMGVGSALFVLPFWGLEKDTSTPQSRSSPIYQYTTTPPPPLTPSPTPTARSSIQLERDRVERQRETGRNTWTIESPTSRAAKSERRRLSE
ncbi:hypothetical protein O988_06439 [Pseudogymnoascus sp. VKM F-3808]|nr:hypothetical protein O988_06439 [Pseudogymnoascus sp. VKM F-3808]